MQGSNPDSYISLLSVGTRLSHRIIQKAFIGPKHGRLWCGMVYSCGNTSCPPGFKCLFSLCPVMEKVQLCPQQGQDKSQCSEFSPLEAAGLSSHPSSFACSWLHQWWNPCCCQPCGYNDHVSVERECSSARGKHATGWATERGKA